MVSDPRDDLIGKFVLIRPGVVFEVVGLSQNPITVDSIDVVTGMSIRINAEHARRNLVERPNTSRTDE